MKRKDREITDQDEIGAILDEAMVCRIGFADGGDPYVVPLSFGYENVAVYLHSAPEGKKIVMLEKNPAAASKWISATTSSGATGPARGGCGTGTLSGTAGLLSSPILKRRSTGLPVSCAIMMVVPMSFQKMISGRSR